MSIYKMHATLPWYIYNFFLFDFWSEGGPLRFDGRPLELIPGANWRSTSKSDNPGAADTSDADVDAAPSTWWTTSKSDNPSWCSSQ